MAYNNFSGTLCQNGMQSAILLDTATHCFRNTNKIIKSVWQKRRPKLRCAGQRAYVRLCVRLVKFGVYIHSISRHNYIMYVYIIYGNRVSVCLTYLYQFSMLSPQSYSSMYNALWWVYSFLKYNIWLIHPFREKNGLSIYACCSSIEYVYVDVHVNVSV